MAYLTFSFESSFWCQLKRTIYFYIYRVVEFVFELFTNISSYLAPEHNQLIISIDERVP